MYNPTLIMANSP